RIAETDGPRAPCQTSHSPTYPLTHLRGHSSFSRIGLYLLALLCFALGLMSKPMLVTLPFVLLLLDFWPLARLERKANNSKFKTVLLLCLEKLPFLALAAGSSFITFVVQRKGGAVSTTISLG